MTYRQAINLFFLINGFIFANWAARIPRIQTDYILDNRLLGFILLAHSIGAFIAMPVTGWLIHKFGSKSITMISGILFPLFFGLIPLMPDYPLLLLPFFFMGMATGIMDVAMNAQAVFVENHLNKPIMTMFHAIFSIGMVAGGLAGGFFTSMEIGLVEHFASMSVISLIVLLWASKFLFPEDPANDDEEEVLFAIPRGPIVGLGVIAFCCMMGEGAMTDWSTNYMKNIVGSAKDFQTFGLIAFAAMMTVGRLFGDRGRVIFGDKKMMVGGAVLSLAGMLFVLTLLHPILVILGFGMVGLGLSNIVPIVYSLAGSFPGIQPGVGIAMSTTIGYTGFMFGPAIIGFLADSYDLRMALVFMAALFALMFALVLQYKKPESQS